MNKWTSAILGAAFGAAASAVYLYLFAPARGTTFDENYQSRLDWALAEGKKAGAERERELITELKQARLSPSKTNSAQSEPLPAPSKPEETTGLTGKEAQDGVGGGAK